MDCSVSVDWLRFQVESSNSRLDIDFLQIIDLPFLPKDVSEISIDADDVLQVEEDFQDGDELTGSSNRRLKAINKYWDKIWEFQGSQVGFLHSIDDRPCRYFVDLNGSTLAFLPNKTLFDLLQFAVCQQKFIGNRIDIALDFPVAEPRLSCREWRSFYDGNLIAGCRSFKAVESVKLGVASNTVYIGSRESETFVRFYDKDIDGNSYDRWEVEYKRHPAEYVMKELVRPNYLESDFVTYLYSTAITSVNLKPSFDTEFFKQYKSLRFGAIKPLRKIPHLDIERTAAFLRRIGPSLATVRELLGPDGFSEFCASSAQQGKPRMKSRHWQMYYAAKVFGYSILSLVFVVGLQAAVLAGGFTCPARLPSGGINDQLVRKFPIDIVLPNPAEQAYLNEVGDGCFAINSGLNFDRVCLPGQIVRALQPIVVLAVGLRFIFSDG